MQSSASNTASIVNSIQKSQVILGSIFVTIEQMTNVALQSFKNKDRFLYNMVMNRFATCKFISMDRLGHINAENVQRECIREYMTQNIIAFFAELQKHPNSQLINGFTDEMIKAVNTKNFELFDMLFDAQSLYQRQHEMASLPQDVFSKLSEIAAANPYAMKQCALQFSYNTFIRRGASCEERNRKLVSTLTVLIQKVSKATTPSQPLTFVSLVELGAQPSSEPSIVAKSAVEPVRSFGSIGSAATDNLLSNGQTRPTAAGSIEPNGRTSSTATDNVLSNGRTSSTADKSETSQQPVSAPVVSAQQPQVHAQQYSMQTQQAAQQLNVLANVADQQRLVQGKEKDNTTRNKAVSGGCMKRLHSQVTNKPIVKAEPDPKEKEKVKPVKRSRLAASGEEPVSAFNDSDDDGDGEVILVSSNPAMVGQSVKNKRC